MALKSIKTNKAYQARQTSSSTDPFNSNWVDPTAPTNTNTDWIDQNFDQGDEFLSPESWSANFWQSFDYNKWTFANGSKPVASTKVAYTAPSTFAWPTTANNLTRAQTTAQIWWRKQDLGMRNMEDIYDPLKKEEQKLPSFDYNTNLSNLYWKWLTDKSAIFWELSKDKSFTALDSIKQQEYITNMQNNIKEMNDAKAKADMTNQEFDPAEYARLKWFDIQTGDVKEIQKWRKEITDTLKYQGTIYDNNAEDMKFKKEQTIKQLDENIEQTKIQVNRQIDDVMKQSQQTIAMWEKVWALKGYNKSWGYVQWLMNIQQEAMQNIQRLQQDLARAEMLTGEDKALAMQEYEKNMTRSKEEFDYKMRSVIADWQTELWRLVMWKYDPKKLWEMLDNLSYDVIQKRMDIEAQYINNIKSANDVVSQQFDQYRAMDDYTDKQRQEFTSILNANNGEALASMSAKDIENFVSQGMLSPEQWAAYYQSMVSKTIWALSEYGIPTQQDVDTIINSIKNGSAPLQAVAWVVQNNPNRYSSVKDKFMTVWANSSIFNTQTGQFMTAPWATTWVSSTYTGKPIPAVAPQTVQQSVQRVIQQYTVWSKWWQCGSFVNNYLQNMWLGRMFVDPIDKKAQLSNSQTPTVWSVAIMDSPSSPQYGHVAIVTKVNPDWSFQTIESNKAWEEKVFTRTMKPWSAKYGFFDPTKWMSAGTWWQDLQMQAMWLTLWLWGTEWERWQIVENLVKVAQRDWITLQEAKKKLWYSTPADNEFKKNMNEQYDWIRKAWSALSQVRSAINALNNPNATTDLVWVVGMLKSIDPNSVARSDEVANVENARSILDTFSNQWEKLGSGKKLTTTQRKQLQDAMMTQVRAYENLEWSFINEVKAEYDNRGLNAKDLFTQSKIDKYNITPEKIKSNVTPAQNVLDKLTTQALAKQGKTTTPTNNVASTSLSARRSSKWK